MAIGRITDFSGKAPTTCGRRGPERTASDWPDWGQGTAQLHPRPVEPAEIDIIGEVQRRRRLIGPELVALPLDAVRMVDHLGQSLGAQRIDDGSPGLPGQFDQAHRRAEVLTHGMSEAFLLCR